jgi:hypothetical protein
MFPRCETYRLYKRGGAGICCDVDGVSLGPVKLVVRVDEEAAKRYSICPAEVLAEALTMAYGPLPGEVMVYLAQGIRRVAESLEDGNVPLAMIKAVHLKFPEIAAENIAKMAASELAKANLGRGKKMIVAEKAVAEIFAGEMAAVLGKALLLSSAKSDKVVTEKYNHNHDERGRFSSGSGGISNRGASNSGIQYAENGVAGIMNDGSPSASGTERKMRRINQNSGGQNGTVVHFVNDEQGKPSPDLPVTEETAKMVEDVVGNSGLKSVTINSTTGGVHKPFSHHYMGKAVDIDMIDGYPVGDPRIKDKVQRLQEAFRAHPNIEQNYGPAFSENIDANGNVVILGGNTVESHKTHIHIGGRN